MGAQSGRPGGGAPPPSSASLGGHTARSAGANSSPPSPRGQREPSQNIASEPGLFRSASTRLPSVAVLGALVFAALGVWETIYQTAVMLEVLAHLPAGMFWMGLGLTRCLIAPVILFLMWRAGAGWKGVLYTVIAAIGVGVFYAQVWMDLFKGAEGFYVYAVAGLAVSLAEVALFTAGALLLSVLWGWLFNRGATSKEEVAARRFRRLLGGALVLAGVLVTTAYAFRPEPHVQLKKELSAHQNPPNRLDLLFVGNSLTYTWSMPAQLETLALAAQVPHVVRPTLLTWPGYPLQWHMRDGVVQAALEGGGFDGVVLQEQSRGIVYSTDTTFASIEQVLPLLQSRGLRVFLYGTWGTDVYLQATPLVNHPWVKRLRKLGQPLDAFSSGGEMLLWSEPQQREQKPLDPRLWQEAYRVAGETFKIPVIPVYTAFQVAKAGKPELELLSDGTHPTKEGAYLTACTFLAVLHGKNPEGLPNKVSSNPGHEPNLGEEEWTEVDPALATYLQQSAWTAVHAPPPKPLEAADLGETDSLYVLAFMQEKTRRPTEATLSWQRYLALGGDRRDVAEAALERLRQAGAQVP